MDGLPIPRVVWLKDNVVVQSRGENVNIATTNNGRSSTLSIRSASVASSNGIYTCMATNNAGSSQRATIVDSMPTSTIPLGEVVLDKP